MFGHLRRAFEGFASNRPYAVSDTILFSAVAAHYFQDAHQPLHATIRAASSTNTLRMENR